MSDCVIQNEFAKRTQFVLVFSGLGLFRCAGGRTKGTPNRNLLSSTLDQPARCRESGVKINVVCPGYVLTPMTAQEHGRKPFAMSAERAAELIANGLDRDKSITAFPRVFTLLTRIGTLLAISGRGPG
jgi:NAD(P)-dependent dehydrogenase (short-subunit alcohol dehydrogenase family)